MERIAERFYVSDVQKPNRLTPQMVELGQTSPMANCLGKCSFTAGTQMHILECYLLCDVLSLASAKKDSNTMNGKTENIKWKVVIFLSFCTFYYRYKNTVEF